MKYPKEKFFEYKQELKNLFTLENRNLTIIEKTAIEIELAKLENFCTILKKIK